MLATLVMSDVAKKDEEIISNQVNTSLKSFNCSHFHMNVDPFPLAIHCSSWNTNSLTPDSHEQRSNRSASSASSRTWEDYCFRWVELSKSVILFVIMCMSTEIVSLIFQQYNDTSHSFGQIKDILDDQFSDTAPKKVNKWSQSCKQIQTDGSLIVVCTTNNIWARRNDNRKISNFKGRIRKNNQ